MLTLGVNESGGAKEVQAVMLGQVLPSTSTRGMEEIVGAGDVLENWPPPPSSPPESHVVGVPSPSDMQAKPVGSLKVTGLLIT